MAGNEKGQALLTRAIGSGIISSLLAQHIQEIDPGDEEKRTFIKQINDKLISRAIKGDMGAIKLVYERIEGRAATQYNLATALAVVQQAAREDLDILAIAMGLPVSALKEKIQSYSNPVLVENPDMPADIDSALATLQQAIAINPQAVRKLIIPLLNNYE